MNQSMTIAVLSLAFLAPATAAAPPLEAAIPAEAAVPADETRYAAMPFDVVREKTFAGVARLGGTAAGEVPEAVLQLWQTVEPGVPARGLHDLVVRSFAAVDPPTAGLLASLDLRNPPRAAPALDALEDRMQDPFYAANLRAHVARFLSDARMFDESLALYDELDFDNVVDPATALFYRSVCEHQLLMKEEGLATITALEERTDDVPESYAALIGLMRADLDALQADSLDEVAGLMRDVERRLGLARGGQRVQKREDEIVSKLDEMIKKIEQQMSQSSSSSGSQSGNSNQSGTPAGDSVVKGSKAPGLVDEKDDLRNGQWGGMPPREREQAKNEIEQAFPANYSRLINEYFLKRTRSDRPAGE